MYCQLKNLPEAARGLSRRERAVLNLRKSVRTWVGRIGRVLRDPGRLWARGRRKGGTGTISPAGRRVLGLAPGERVRVRPFEEILSTLDAEGRAEGLGFMTAAMKKYCGGDFTVRKRVRFFFDERRREMRKGRDIVILDGVYCETPPAEADDWSGCERTCFLFWKEAWLERLPDEGRKTPCP